MSPSFPAVLMGRYFCLPNEAALGLEPKRGRFPFNESYLRRNAFSSFLGNN
jgi:hypothetical protein